MKYSLISLLKDKQPGKNSQMPLQITQSTFVSENKVFIKQKIKKYIYIYIIVYNLNSVFNYSIPIGFILINL